MKKLCKSNKDKKLCGVCGGIAEYLGVDSTLVRLAVVIVSAIAGSGLLVYFLAALIMPEQPVETFQSFYSETSADDDIPRYDQRNHY